MIQQVLRENRIVILLFIIIFISCSKESKNYKVERFYPKITINKVLEKEILCFREDLQRLQATNENKISVLFIKRNDTLFIELGNYEPNFEFVDIKGVDVIEKDTVYLFSENNLPEIEQFYNSNFTSKIRIIDNTKPNFSHYDPYYQCFYLNGSRIKILCHHKCR